MARLFLLRHGATALNRLVPYRLQGRHTDPPLDELGVSQAGAAARALVAAGVRLVAIYSSPLRRAVETARIVGAPHGIAPVERAELIEADVGRWEGRTWEEIEASEPEAFARFMADPGTVPYPGGESFRDVQRRARPALERVAADHPGRDVAVVGHNVVNRAVLAHLLGVPIERARALRQSNGGINIIEMGEAGLRVATLNAALHLEGIEETGSPTEGAGA